MSRTKFLSSASDDAASTEAGSAATLDPNPKITSDLLASSSETPASVVADPLLGRVIDSRYQVESVLGQGGMGIVYRGRHKVIDKRVAIKVLRGEMARDKEVTERFLQEAKAASSIGNPHIIDISDFGVLPDGSTYFVMEYLDGKSLTDLMEESRPVPVTRIVHIVKQIAQGLAAAHAAGIVHRDLKPDNIMLINRGSEKDFVKILDFGIAKVSSGETNRLTRAGSIFGTPHYMSPEQAAGAQVNHATDLYSLGVIMYELSAGKVPFDAENFMGILTMHMYKAPPPMRALVPQPDVPPGLDAIVLKCLSKKPEGRYTNMDALFADLEKFQTGAMPDAVNEMMARSGGFNVPADYFRTSGMPAPMPATPPRKSAKWPLYAGIAGVVTAIAIVVGIFAKSSNSSADIKSDPATVATTTTATAPTSVNVVPAVATHSVVVALDPSDAKATINGQDQKNPVVVSLKDGESATLIVSKAGFVAQTLTVNATDASRVLKLAPVAVVPTGNGRPSGGTKPSGGTRPNGTGTPSGGMGNDSDPWKTH